MIFENVSGYGNNLYLDNILLSEDDPLDGCSNKSIRNISVENSGITIHPDPEDGILTIEGIIGNYQIEIRDVTGNLFRVVSGSNTVNISLGELPPGLYFISIIKDGTALLAVEKILKE